MTQVRSYLQTLMAVDDRPRQLHKGETLFEQGTPGKEMYIVRSGTIVLRAGGRTLEEVGPGGVIGEMALIDASPRSASAVAADECSVTMVNEYTLLELVKKVPGLSLEIMRIMAGRLRRANAAHKDDKPQPRPKKSAAPRTRARKPARKKK